MAQPARLTSGLLARKGQALPAASPMPGSIWCRPCLRRPGPSSHAAARPRRVRCCCPTSGVPRRRMRRAGGPPTPKAIGWRSPCGSTARATPASRSWPRGALVPARRCWCGRSTPTSRHAPQTALPAHRRQVRRVLSRPEVGLERLPNVSQVPRRGAASAPQSSTGPVCVPRSRAAARRGGPGRRPDHPRRGADDRRPPPRRPLPGERAGAELSALLHFWARSAAPASTSTRTA
jgi:hypothetical protein